MRHPLFLIAAMLLAGASAMAEIKPAPGAPTGLLPFMLTSLGMPGTWVWVLVGQIKTADFATPAFQSVPSAWNKLATY